MDETTNVDETVEEELVDKELQDESDSNEDSGDEESEVEDSSAIQDEDDRIEQARKDRKARADSQIDRLKRENKDLKAKIAEGGSESSEEVKPTNSRLIELAYLSAEGIKEKPVQEEVIRLAKKFGMSVDEALEDTDIRMRANSLTKKITADRSVASATGGAGKKTKGTQYYVAQFNKTGEFPANMSNEMIAKVTDVLAKQ